MPETVDRPLAHKLFEAVRELSSLEDDIDELLDTAKIPYADWWVDWYDSSIEITGNTGLTDAQISVLWAAGFSRVWTHAVADKDYIDRASQKYYVNPEHAIGV